MPTFGGVATATRPVGERARDDGGRSVSSWSRSFSAPQRRTRRLSDSLWSWSACALDVQWDGRHARRNDVQRDEEVATGGGQVRGRGLGTAIGWMDRVGGSARFGGGRLRGCGRLGRARGGIRRGR